MTTITEHSGKRINVLSIEIQEGVGIGATAQGDNKQIANHYASLGYSLYFPPGDYEFAGTISWSSAAGVSVTGDGARLYQMNTGNRLLQFTSCSNVRVSGLHTHGAYHQTQVKSNANDTESHIWASQCDQVAIVDNICQGNSGTCVRIEGGDTIEVRGNVFIDGTWDDTGGGFAEAADIFVKNHASSIARQITITDNRCNTNSLVGIELLYATRKLICSGNHAICMDASGNELTTYAADMRKAGIELQYYTDGQGTVDDSLYEMQCSDNIVQGARFAGITMQSSATGAGNAGGIRGAITGNQVRYVALDTGAVSEYVHAAILVEQYRDVVIANNVITDVAETFNTNGSAGIGVGCTSETTVGDYSSCVITGNTLKRIDGTGIRINREAADIVISDNIVRECKDRLLWFTGSGGTRFGQCTIIGNRFIDTTDVDRNAIEITGGSTGQEVTFVANQVQVTGTWNSAVYCCYIWSPRCTVAGNRFYGVATANARCLYVSFAGASARHPEAHIDGNHFEDWGYAVYTDGGVDNTKGPIVHSNCSFQNCTNIVWSSQADIIYPGVRHSPASLNYTTLEVYHDAIPTGGNWVIGDRVKHPSPATGTPQGWICTAAGNPGTWTPLPNMP